MADVVLTSRYIEVARHALGLNRSPFATRNYFVAGNDGDDHRTWQALMLAGLATARPHALAMDCTCFRLTRAGAAAVLRPGEQLGTIFED